MRRTEGGAICLQILFRSGRQRFERINALVVYENTQVQMWACGPAGRADGCDDLPLRNGIAGFGIECTQMRVHRPDAVFMPTPLFKHEAPLTDYLLIIKMEKCVCCSCLI